MKATQVFFQAKQNARQHQTPYVVYTNAEGDVQLSPTIWAQAVASIAPSLSETESLCGFAFPSGRFEGAYR